MAITLSGLTLPNALRWVEQFDQSLRQVSQETIGGVSDVYYGTASGWQPMTLEGLGESASMPLSDLATLAAMMEAGESLTLTMHDSSVHTVRPRIESNRAVEWEQIFPVHDPASGDVVRIKNIFLWRFS